MARQITTKEMYTDVNGNLIAQYYDPSIDDFVPFAEQSAVRILDKDGNPISSDNGLPVQLTGSNVEYQLLDQVQISAGSTVFSQNLTHFADKYSVYVQSNPASDFSISIRPRRLDGVESGEGVDRFEESYTDRVRIVTDEFISRSPSLNIGIRNDTSEVVTYSVWVYVKGASN